jgi:tRNA(Ile2) C34 agmatinyltransferase TiaS
MTEITYNNKCTPYSYNNYDEHMTPCTCPVCGGFLKSDFDEKPFNCKKCGSELAAIEHSESFKESDDYDFSEGKICVLERRTKTKQQTKEERQTNRLVKEGAKKWKGWL